MEKKEVLIIGVAVVLFASGAVTAAVKTVAKTAVRISDRATTKSSNEKIVEDTVDLSKFNELELDISSLDTYIEEGDSYKLEYRVRERYVPIVDEHGDKLVIKQPKSKITINIGKIFDNKEEYYKLTVPKDAGVLDVDLNASSGSINVDNIDIEGKIEISSGEIKLADIDSKKLKIDATSGDMKIKDVNIEKFGIEISSGDVRITNCKTDDLDAHLTSGNMEFDEIEFNKANFEMTSGRIDANVVGSKKDYSYNLKATSGDMRVDGEKYEKKFQSDDGQKKTITADMTSGDLDINFSE